MGVLSTGTNLTHVSFIAGQEAITSEAGYSTSLKGTWVHGSDYIKTDADGGKSRLEVDSLVKDTATGGLVRYRYTGVVDMSGPAGKVLRGDADAATTEFGDICEYTRVKQANFRCIFFWSNMCACSRAYTQSRTSSSRRAILSSRSWRTRSSLALGASSWRQASLSLSSTRSVRCRCDLHISRQSTR